MHSTITENNEQFLKATYNGISIFVREKDGFINVTKLCGDGGRDFHTFRRGNRFRSILEYYEKFEVPKDRQNCRPLYELKKGYNKMQGQYLTPDLIHFVAEWISIEYSFAVKHVMDSINDKVHEVLTSQQLPDTPENAKPAFVEVVKQIAPSVNIELINKQCWCYRERWNELDQWEQDDLRRDVNEYQKMKERLDELEKKVNEWGSYVKQYCPEFQK